MGDIQNLFNPDLDLKLERVVDVPRELIWKAWTTPELLKQWFTPEPWKTTECKMDLRPGGLFLTTMQGPDGESMSGSGCFLELIENEKLVWTDALTQDFRPAANPNGCMDNFFTAKVILEPHEQGTKYTAIAMHPSAEARQKHADMGFQEGWGKALDQLVALVKTM